MALADAILMYGIRAAQPAAAPENNGVYYRVTDESDIVEQSDGSTWTQISGGGGGGDVSAVGTLDNNELIIGQGGTDIASITTGTGILTALGINTGSAGAPVLFNGALGTPSSGTLTSATGLPISTGVTGLGTGVATYLATPSNANLAAATRGIPQYIIATADESINNDTLQNDDEIAWAVGTSEVWVFDGTLQFTSGASSTPDVKMTWTIPTSATLTWTVFANSTGATTATDNTLGSELEATTPATFARGIRTSATSPILISGVLRTAGTAGTMQFQWAQNTTTGGTPTVREKDSWLRYTRIA